MAPSQTSQQQEQFLGQGYTHKKFNCGYSHKKLGLRFRAREPVQNENIAPTQTKQLKVAKHSKDIFRPYALDESNTPRKRKISSSTVEEPLKMEDISTIPKAAHVASNITKEPNHHHWQSVPLSIDAEISSCPAAITSLESCYAPALSPNSYEMRLQRQRAALYMRYMAQVQSENFTVNLQPAINYCMGYPNVTAPIFNGC